MKLVKYIMAKAVRDAGLASPLILDLPAKLWAELEMVARYESLSPHTIAIGAIKKGVQDAKGTILTNAIDELMDWLEPKHPEGPWRTIPSGIFLPSLARIAGENEAVEAWLLRVQQEAVETILEGGSLALLRVDPDLGCQVALVEHLQNAREV